jgi:hypothetical protein
LCNCFIVIFLYMHIVYFNQTHPLYYSFLPTLSSLEFDFLRTWREVWGVLPKLRTVNEKMLLSGWLTLSVPRVWKHLPLME